MSCPKKPDDRRLEGLEVIVVDDENDVRKGLERLVGGRGANVRSAPDGLRALALLRERPADLVISDIRMPRMTGVELLDAVKAEWPETAVLMMTGFGTIELAVSCMGAGAAHFIAKPFENHEMIRAVEAIGRIILARRSPDAGGTERFVVRDALMLELMEKVEQVAGTRLPVLIEGETGTGKELVAQEIHGRGPLRDRPFLAVNCAALPDTLLESELFGHQKGAFTGAEADREGLFAQARGGTVFLDEIASMSGAFQGKLLRVLQDKVVRPLGGDHDVAVDFRLLAATNRSLPEMVDAGTFRDDLLYRLRVLHVLIPPLRRRREDVSALAEHFVRKLTPECRGPDARAPRLTGEALRLLRGHTWPGNVRELQSCVMRGLVACRGDVLEPHHFDLTTADAPALSYEDGKKAAIERFQRRFIEDVLSSTSGNVSRAAESCGLTRAALQKIMRTLAIDRESFATRSD